MTKFRNEKMETYILEALYKYICLDYFTLKIYISNKLNKEISFRIDTYLRYLKKNEDIKMIEIDNKNAYVINQDKIDEIGEGKFKNSLFMQQIHKLQDEDIKKYYYLSSFFINACNSNSVKYSNSYFSVKQKDNNYPIAYITGKKTINYFNREGSIPFCIYAFSDASDNEFIENIDQIIRLLAHNKSFLGISLMVNICENFEEVYNKVSLLSNLGRMVPVTFSLNINSEKSPLKNLFKCEIIEGKYVIKKIYL